MSGAGDHLQEGNAGKLLEIWERASALQSCMIYNYRVLLTIKYSKQFSEYKASVKPGKKDWWEFIKRLHLDTNNESNCVVMLAENAQSFDPLPSLDEALDLLVTGAADYCWIDIIREVYKNLQKIEDQKILVKDMFY